MPHTARRSGGISEADGYRAGRVATFLCNLPDVVLGTVFKSHLAKLSNAHRSCG